MTDEERKIKRREYARKYYAANKEKVKEYHRKYRKENAETINLYNRMYRRNNPASVKRWRETAAMNMCYKMIERERIEKENQ